MLAGVDVVEPQVATDPHEMEYVGEPLHHVAVAGVLEEAGEGESEFHGVVLDPRRKSVRIVANGQSPCHVR